MKIKRDERPFNLRVVKISFSQLGASWTRQGTSVPKKLPGISWLDLMLTSQS